VPLSCALLDAELLQTTITGFAQRCQRLQPKRPGALLMLDVDQLPPQAQSELAGFLTLPKFTLHVIAIARTNVLDKNAGVAFDRELAHALSTLVIELPPLAERREDIPLLAQHFLESFNAEGGRQLSGFTPEALDLLSEYKWPHNVEQLREFVLKACRQAEGLQVDANDLPEAIRLASQAEKLQKKHSSVQEINLDQFLEEVEKELIQRALRQAKGNKAKAARMLGVSRPRLLRRVDMLGIE
jgi:DNA-binding NtrC family response regulator